MLKRFWTSLPSLNMRNISGLRGTVATSSLAPAPSCPKLTEAFCLRKILENLPHCRKLEKYSGVERNGCNYNSSGSISPHQLSSLLPKMSNLDSKSRQTKHGCSLLGISVKTTFGLKTLEISSKQEWILYQLDGALCSRIFQCVKISF